jgi:hypothetical protein
MVGEFDGPDEGLAVGTVDDIRLGIIDEGYSDGI